MKVVYVPVNEKPRVIDLKNDLPALQNAVGGDIEIVQPFEDYDIVLVCNEEGKFNGMEINRTLVDEGGRILDYIAGNFFIANTKDGDFCGMDQAMLDKYEKVFSGSVAVI